MTRLRHLCLLLAVYLLTACSIDGEGAAVIPTRGAQEAPAQGAGRAINGRLLYVREGGIWIHQGTEAQRLNVEGAVRDPALAPNGAWLAYIRREESYSNLYILNLETGEPVQLTFNASALPPRTQDYVHQVIWAAKPTWSPDSQEIIFLSQVRPPTSEGESPSLYEFPLALYRYPMELVGIREPTNDDLLPVDQGNSDVLSPAWAPDGRFLAYVDTPRGNEPRRMMLYDLEAQEAQPFPGVPEGAYDPAWSPDGSRLAFAVSQGGATDLWLVDAPPGSSSPQRITNLGRARAPAWSPDGSSVAFVNVGDTSSDVYVVDLRQEEGRLTPGVPEQVTFGADIDVTAGMSWGE